MKLNGQKTHLNHFDDEDEREGQHGGDHEERQTSEEVGEQARPLLTSCSRRIMALNIHVYHLVDRDKHPSWRWLFVQYNVNEMVKFSLMNCRIHCLVLLLPCCIF